MSNWLERAQRRHASESRHRSRRLRKKLAVGEFREFGFEVRMTVVEGLTIDDHNALWTEFAEALESRGLQYGGGLDDGFAIAEARPTTEEDRAIVRAWLESRRDIVACGIGPLVDANMPHPWSFLPR